MDSRLLDAVWRIPGRSTRAVVDLDAIAGNVRAARAISVGAGLMAVVKADAYGHGAIPVAEAALDAGASALGVATVDEGVRLREAGINAPVLVLGPVDRDEITVAVGRGIELAVGDIRTAHDIALCVERQAIGFAAPVHLKIDTGMRRFGVEPEAALAVAQFIVDRPSLRLRGVFTHFACADEADDQPTADQADRFERVLNGLAAAGIEPEIVHAANTASALRSTPYVRGLVRLGIGLYGLDPSPDVRLPAGMRPALTWLSRIRRVMELAPGDGVSYGATYRATGKELAALVPVGYADGYRRCFSNLGNMGIGGGTASVRGRVCMDQTVVGVTPAAPVSVGDPVVIAAPPGTLSGPTIDDLATWATTINYEIVCGISPRVPRVYVRGGAVVAVADLNGYRPYSRSMDHK